jgi:hypothetical protein
MLRKLLLTGVVLAAFSGSAHAATILDGSFEDLHFANGHYVYNPTGSAWTFTGGAGETGNSSAWGFAPASDGNVVAFLQNVSSISQTLTGLTAGRTYTVSFDLAHRPGYGQNAVSLSFDGASIFTQTPTSDAWTAYTASFTATGTSGLLSFSTNLNWGDNDSGLDHVRITNAQAAVPEPASWAMMLGGFGLVGGAMRSRRKAAIRFA